MSVAQVPVQAGKLPSQHAFAEWSGEGLALSAVKVNESGNDLVFRWYNMTERQTELSLDTTGRFGAFYRSSILEERGEKTNAAGNAALSVGPAEIVTLCAAADE
jgi:alpha-mannosidase